VEAAASHHRKPTTQRPRRCTGRHRLPRRRRHRHVVTFRLPTFWVRCCRAGSHSAGCNETTRS